MKKTLALLSLCATLVAAPAWALDLHEARAQNLVGEKPDGYVAAVKPGDEVDALVSDVNAKRKQEYTRISKEKGQPVNVVGTLAAEEIIKNLPAGSSYQGSDGSWKTR